MNPDRDQIFAPPRPIKKPNGVQLGHVPGASTSWKEAMQNNAGILSDFKRFKRTRKKVEKYVPQLVTLGQPPLPSPDVVHYTDDSASLSGQQGGGYMPIDCSNYPAISLSHILQHLIG